MSEENTVPVEITLTAAQLANLERFQREQGFASRDAAARLLLDIAFEAVSGRGRRFWDKPAFGDPAISQARALAERLQAEGHDDPAARLHQATEGDRIGHAVLETVREACQTVLTMIEAIDPKTRMLAEELRLEVDKRLAP